MQFTQFHFLSHLPRLQHYITTRRGGVSKNAFTSLNLAFHVGDNPVAVRKNRRLLADVAGFDIANLVVAQQVHGDHIHVVNADDAGRGASGQDEAIPNTDALITAQRDIPLLIQVADCAPVLLADVSAQILGVAHAGWRGALAGIAGKTTREMVEISADAKSTFAGVGPCLCTNCLEVGAEVADLVTPHYPDAVRLARSDTKPHLDLRAIIWQDLVNAGLKPNNIEIMPDCPKCDTQKYFSYRAEKQKTGRFGLVAWWEG